MTRPNCSSDRDTKQTTMTNNIEEYISYGRIPATDSETILKLPHKTQILKTANVFSNLE